MEELDLSIDPYASDPGHWGASLAALAEIVFPCLDAVRPRSVVEIGAYSGDLTRLLVEWGAPRGTQTVAIDPAPKPKLVKLAEQQSSLELIQLPSLEALKELPPADVAIIDGDHNYYTVTGELRLIADRADQESASLPLLLLHDVCWPHARRDSYHDPSSIPPEHRQPVVEGPGLYPGVEGVRPGGLPYHFAAQSEGGPRNGVLTAVEDFMSGSERLRPAAGDELHSAGRDRLRPAAREASRPAGPDGLRLAVIPAFFGLGVIWPVDASWSDTVAEIVDPWDRNPLLARLEENRVLHLASSHFQMVQAAHQAQLNAHKDELLEEMLKSRAFTLAERLSWLHQRGNPAFTREAVRRLLAER